MLNEEKINLKLANRANEFLEKIDNVTKAVKDDDIERAIAELDRIVFLYGLVLGELSRFYEQADQIERTMDEFKKMQRDRL